VSLRFQRWLGVEKNTYDHANIQVSNDRINWTTIWENPASDISDTAWTLQEFDISEIADSQPRVFIRWMMGPTDGSYRFCGWNIDDVEIIAIRPPIVQTFVNIQNTTVAPGGIVGPVTVDITNNTDSDCVVRENPYIVEPDDDTIWLRPRLRGIPANTTRRRRFRLRIPPVFELGEYTYGIVLTDIDGNEIDHDWFNFNVIAATGPTAGEYEPANKNREQAGQYIIVDE